MNTNLDLALRKAAWILCPQEIDAPIIRRSFSISTEASAVVALSALGFYKLYVNGQAVGDEFFRPSNSLFHARDPKSWIYPIRDSFTYRAYYSTIDITPWLCKGENVIEVILPLGPNTHTEWMYLLGNFDVEVDGRNARIVAAGNDRSESSAAHCCST